jgi:hypothetical protein
MAKVKCVKIIRPGYNESGYIVNCDNNVIQEELEVFIENDNEGDKLQFEIVEMEESRLNALKEFEGW